MYASFTDVLAVLYLLVAGDSALHPKESAQNGIKQAVSAEEPSTTPAATGESTACGDIIDLVNEGSRVFYAEEVYACLTSVPFSNTIAQRFLTYYTDSVQFQSTLAYVRSPPDDYQQPSVDVIKGLEAVRKKSAAGGYPNQYEFEADVQRVVYSMHDSHVDLYAGVLSAFGFGSPKNLVSISEDGVKEPKIFLDEDAREFARNGQEISAIESINDEPVIDYLTKYAALNSVGMLEPHADWNQIMYAPAQDISDELNIFNGGGTFYPGDELNFTFANGSTLETFWLAVYNNPDFTGPLTNGSDFFNYFVLGQLPDNYDSVELPPAFQISVQDIPADEAEGEEAADPGFFDLTGGAYPQKPDVSGGALVTGYFLDGISTGVLSLPNFEAFGYGVQRYSDLVDDFITGAKERKLSKVIIDLQQNRGGTSQLAFVTFRQFFPRIEPFSGSRRRSHDHADVLGSTITAWWDGLKLGEGDDKRSHAADEWVVTNRLNAETGKTFTSWKEYFGPKEHNGDQFSLTERYDLANQIFDAAAFDGVIPTQFTQGRNRERMEPWSARDIVLLTDGTCASTCALFVEMMSQEAGVRTIVVGGRPESGAMQAASGSRGALIYSAGAITSDISLAVSIDNTVASRLPTKRDDSGMYVIQASLNLRDQVRPRDLTPLQFQYLPADCRLYWTFKTAYNMTRLWETVSSAAFDDSSTVCVEGSTGHAKPKPNSLPAATLPTVPEFDPAEDDVADITFVDDPDLASSNGLQAGRSRRLADLSNVTPCDPSLGSKNCVDGGTCQPIPMECDATRQGKEYVYACVGSCVSNDMVCEDDARATPMMCFVQNPGKPVESKANRVKGTGKTGTGGESIKLGKNGVCIPKNPTTALCMSRFNQGQVAPPLVTRPIGQAAPPPGTPPVGQGAPPLGTRPINQAAPPPGTRPIGQAPPPPVPLPVGQGAPPPGTRPINQAAPPPGPLPVGQGAPPLGTRPINQPAPPPGPLPVGQGAPPLGTRPISQPAPPPRPLPVGQGAPPPGARPISQGRPSGTRPIGQGVRAPKT